LSWLTCKIVLPRTERPEDPVFQKASVPLPRRLFRMEQLLILLESLGGDPHYSIHLALKKDEQRSRSLWRRLWDAFHDSPRSPYF